MVKINFHSFVDVITNSSTELFVLDTDKSVEMVKELLQQAIDLHNSIDKTKCTFEEIFDEPYFGTPSIALEGWEDYYKSNKEESIIVCGADDNSIPYWMFEFIESAFGYSTERYHLG